MFNSLPKSMQKWSGIQWAFSALILFFLLFLFVGTASQSVAPDENSFGLASQSFALFAMAAFIAGLISFVSPCTLPILPAYFAFAFQSGRRQIAINTIAFMFGLATMFSVLGATASALGQLLNQNRGLLVLLGGGMILIFGVMSLIGNGFTGLQQQSTTRQTTLSGSYLFGITFAIGWSGCIGPILGAVLTMAATTSLLRGMLLLFIYALGLGLPLLIVSTLFGKASRKSLIWRILRGKGWQVETTIWALIAVWSFAIWRILVALTKYLFFSDFTTVANFTTSHELGLLLLSVLLVAAWFYLGKSGSRVELNLHSTQLISGGLFILFGSLMLSGRLAEFNSIVSPELTEWFADLEYWFIDFIS